MSAPVLKLSDEQAAHLRVASDRHDLRQRWGVSLSTMYALLRACWVAQGKAIATELRSNANVTVAKMQRKIAARHLNLTYSELVGALSALDQARAISSRRYVVDILEKKERKER